MQISNLQCKNCLYDYSQHYPEDGKPWLGCDDFQSRAVASLGLMDSRVDIINNPPHYTESGLEPITVIEAWGLSFCLGNAVKYIARHGKKDPSKVIEDLKKAEWYIKREISNLEKTK